MPIIGSWLNDTVSTDLNTPQLLIGDMGSLASWTLLAGTEGGSISTIGSSMVFNQGAASNMHAYQEFPVVAGRTYLVAVTAFTGNSFDLTLSAGAAAPISDTPYIGSYETKSVSAYGVLFITFTAIASDSETAYFVVSDNQGASQASIWSSASALQALADTSSNNNGLAVYAPLTKAPVVEGAFLTGVAGFLQARMYLEQPPNSIYNAGLLDFTYMLWAKVESASAANPLIERATFGAAVGVSIGVQIAASGAITASVSDDGQTTADTVSGPVGQDDGVWKLIAFGRSGSTWILSMNGVQVGSAPVNAASAPLDSTTAALRLGGAPETTITRPRIANEYITLLEQLAIYEAEKKDMVPFIANKSGFGSTLAFGAIG